MTYEFKILAFENYDGDSFDLTLDLGFDLILHKKCRIYGIDTPELRGGTEESKAAGRLARDEARAFVQSALDAGQEAIFASLDYTGKFGRPLGDIVVHADDGETVKLTDMLLAQNLAVPYHGQAKAKVQAEHDANIKILRTTGRI